MDLSPFFRRSRVAAIVVVLLLLMSNAHSVRSPVETSSPPLPKTIITEQKSPQLSSSTTSSDQVHIQDQVHIKDKAHVEKTVKGLIDGGTQKLQLIIDFDYTLTRVHKDGEPVDCSWGVMENSHLLPDEYVAKTRENKLKYMPIEHDPSLTIEQKIPHMIEWYTKANKLLQECGVSRNLFHDMVTASNVDFRDGSNHMLDVLASVNVPVLILSAGLGDLIVEVLKHRGVYHDNIKIVSNFLKYDENGIVAGLDGDMIHMFNKNENSVHDSSYFKDLQHRPNVILMGDSLGDLRMAEGVEDPEHVLKIGFLNNQIEEKLEKYMDSFDVVLADDQTMDFPNAIIERILKTERDPVEL